MSLCGPSSESQPCVLVLNESQNAFLPESDFFEKRNWRAFEFKSTEDVVASHYVHTANYLICHFSQLHSRELERIQQIRKHNLKLAILLVLNEPLTAEMKKQIFSFGAVEVLYLPLISEELEEKICGSIQTQQKLKNYNQEFLQVPGEMAARFRQFDWSQHVLGPIEKWDHSLKTAVGLMLRSAFPQFISWGPEKIFLYNDAYQPILGLEKHPSGFAGKFQEVWADIWADLSPIVERVARGESSFFEDLPLYMNRNGYFEQTYFTFSYSPILDDTGQVQGLFCSCVETTGRKTTEEALRRSEESLQLALESAQMGTWYLDIKTQQMTLSNHLVEIFGRELPNSLQDIISQAIYVDDRERVVQALNEAIQERRPFATECRLVRPDGSIRWILSRGNATYEADGTPSTVTGVLVDINERKNLERQRQDQIEILEAVFATMTEGVVFLDPSGELLRMNQEALRQHGFGHHEDMIRTLPDFAKFLVLETLDGRALDIPEWPASRVLRGERFTNYEVSLYDQRTQRRWIGSYGGSAIYDENGQMVLGVLSVRDVTAQKRAELHLRDSESRLQLTIEAIPQGVWRTNPDGSADYFSEKFSQLVGYPLEELLGWGWAQVIHADDRPRVLAEWQRCRDLKQPVSVDFRVVKPDGSSRWHLSLGNPFFDSQGNLIKYFGTWVDIHNERLAQKELQMKSEALENSLNGFDIVNSKGELIYANKTYLKMWGYDSLEEILGTSPVSHCLDPEIPMKIISTLKQKGECNIEFKALRKDGSTFDVMMWARLAHDAEGNEIYPTTSIDITDRKRAESQLLMAKEEAEKANELKSAFLANMSHEIRTPLGAMIGFADLIKDPDLSSEDRNEFVDILVRNGEQLRVIIDDILDLSKVEAGHLNLDLAEMSLPDVIEDVVLLLQVKARQKNLALELEIEPSTPQMIVSDSTRVRQILLNLIGNSIKFTEKGSVRVRSFGFLNPEGRMMAGFEIQDTGVGIPEEQKDRIFEVFVQGDGSMTRRFGGTGLGLALSRRLARALGGDVQVCWSEVGQGTSMQLSILDASPSKSAQSQSMPASKSLSPTDWVLEAPDLT